MLKILNVLLFLSFFVAHLPGNEAAFTPQPTEAYRYNTVLDEDGNYHLYWKYDNSTITLEVHVKTLGWVGLGLSQTGGMKGADIAVGWVKDGRAVLHDTHAVGKSQPLKDPQQDLTLLKAIEGNGVTTLKFSRKLVSCDAQHDLDILDETIKLIYAYGPDDPTDLESVQQHSATSRGQKSVRLREPEGARPKLPDDAMSVDFRNSNVTVPEETTTYYCTIFRFPNLTQPHHLIRAEPLITPGNEGVVHHYNVWQCRGQLNATDVGMGHTCAHPNMAQKTAAGECWTAVTVWAVGGGSFDFPEHVGYRVGSGAGPDFLVLEVHYNNPENKKDIIDSSGVRFTLTKQLRANDAGVLEMGTWPNPNQVIPPNFPALRMRGFCNSDCLSKHMKGVTRKLNVFANFLHSHLLGRKLITRLIRNGEEVTSLGRDTNYDFDFQETRLFQKEVELYPGDSIVLDCDYDSTGRTGLSRGGFSTYEEMCLAYTYYYPKLDLTHCEVTLPQESLLHFAGATAVNSSVQPMVATSPRNLAGKNVTELFTAMDWADESLRDKYQAFLLNTSIPYNPMCMAKEFGFGSAWNKTEPVHAPDFKPKDYSPTRKCESSGVERSSIGSAVALAICFFFGAFMI